jgi:hypothetical protein
MHSHGGAYIREDTGPYPVADAMRAGGVTAASLAIVSDAPTTQVFADRRIRPRAIPSPVFYAWSQASFALMRGIMQCTLSTKTQPDRRVPATGMRFVCQLKLSPAVRRHRGNFWRHLWLPSFFTTPRNGPRANVVDR